MNDSVFQTDERITLYFFILVSVIVTVHTKNQTKKIMPDTYEVEFLRKIEKISVPTTYG